MDVCVVSCVFPPEPVVSARTSSQIAEELVRLGHKVTVIAPFPSRPSGEIFPGFGGRWYRRDVSVAGYDLIRCPAFPSKKSTLLSRLLENGSFGISAVIALALLPRSQVIYANTWPLLATGLLAALARVRRIPVVISVQDIYPESLFVQNRVHQKSVLARALTWLDKKIAGSAALLVVLSERFKQLYSQTRAVPAEKLHVVPNWGNPVEFDPEISERRRFHQQIGIPSDAFCFVYAGNIGTAAGLEDVIRAFEQLGSKNIYLLIAGSGARLETCRQLALELGVNRVLFYSPWQEAETALILGLADAFILPTSSGQSLASAPSKLVTYMLSARPVLAVAEPGSETEAVIRAAGCGRVLPPNQPQQLRQALVEFSQLPGELLNQMGEAGRLYAGRHFGQEEQLKKVVDVILDAGRAKSKLERRPI